MVGFVRKGWFGNLALLVLALCCQAKGYPKAPICDKLECPQYVVVESQNDFEIRTYRQDRWVNTLPTNDTSYIKAYAEAYNILLAYINGENQQSLKVNMTAPVVTKVIPSASGVSTFTVYIYMPQEFQVLTPSSPKIMLGTLPEQAYAAVRRFSGSMDDVSIPAEVSALKQSLKGTAWEAATTVENYSAAGYNSPSQMDNLVNEVMLWFAK